jgi:hypothetical protein
MPGPDDLGSKPPPTTLATWASHELAQLPDAGGAVTAAGCLEPDDDRARRKQQPVRTILAANRDQHLRFVEEADQRHALRIDLGRLLELTTAPVPAAQLLEQEFDRSIAEPCVYRRMDVDLDAPPAVGTPAAQEQSLTSLEEPQDRLDLDHLARGRVERPSRHQELRQLTQPLAAIELIALPLADIMGHDRIVARPSG